MKLKYYENHLRNLKVSAIEHHEPRGVPVSKLIKEYDVYQYKQTIEVSLTTNTLGVTLSNSVNVRFRGKYSDC